LPVDVYNNNMPAVSDYAPTAEEIGGSTSNTTEPVVNPDEEEEEGSAPTVTRPANPTYSGPDVTFTSAWSGYIALDGNKYPAVANVGNGTVIRVYGYGTSSDWHVKTAYQTTEWNDIEEKKGSNSYVFTEPLSFTLTAEAATHLKNSGTLIIYGKDYVVKYVDIDNSGVTPSTTSYDGTVLWGGDGSTLEPNWYGSVRVTPGPKITSAAGKIRFYGVLKDTSDPKITVLTTKDGNDTKILECTFEEPYVEVDVTQQIMNDLAGYAGLIINGQQFTLTAITWVH